MKKEWYLSKTNWTTILTAVVNVVAAVTGFVLPSWFNEAALGLIFIFLRQTAANSGPGA